LAYCPGMDELAGLTEDARRWPSIGSVYFCLTLSRTRHCRL
jgi:hypothetical protein